MRVKFCVPYKMNTCYFGQSPSIFYNKEVSCQKSILICYFIDVRKSWFSTWWNLISVSLFEKRYKAGTSNDNNFNASTFMFSGCPSVRPKPGIPSFHLYMGPLVHPTNRDRFCGMSVRPGRFPCLCRRMHRGNSLKFCMLTCLGHLQNWAVCWYSSFWHHLDLMKQVKFGGSWHFPENAYRE